MHLLYAWKQVSQEGVGTTASLQTHLRGLGVLHAPLSEGRLGYLTTLHVNLIICLGCNTDMFVDTNRVLAIPTAPPISNSLTLKG